MLTAKGDPMDRIIGLEMGADDYLPKPFEPRELLARIRAVLRRQSEPAALSQPCCALARLRLISDARVVSVGGQACDLTSYQFDLLVALAERAGRVLTRDQIMEAVRGRELDAFDRSIDVHMGRIRAAIELDAKVAQAHPDGAWRWLRLCPPARLSAGFCHVQQALRPYLACGGAGGGGAGFAGGLDLADGRRPTAA
jgi:DNA-binding response OmpR family regulator